MRSGGTELLYFITIERIIIQIMKTVVKDLFRKQDEFGEKEITVSGWIRNIRISKNFGFIELNDGTFFKNLQIVIESDKLDNFAELSKLNIAAAITATGTLVLTPDANSRLN